MPSNYNKSAWFYDRLSRLVYGRAVIHAQVYLLKYVPKGANILIVGGGTGWILDELTKIQSSGLTITYVEIAADMMALSQKRNTGQNEVIFMNDAIENITHQPVFNVVITPFLFDNFTEQTLQTVFGQIHALLKPGGIWLNTDFQLTGKWWQNVLLKSMFLFFRIICRIEASRLPDVEAHFSFHQYKNIASKTFFYDFIISKAFKRIAD